MSGALAAGPAAPQSQAAQTPRARTADAALMRPWYRFWRVICHIFFLLFFRGRVFHRERVPLTGGVLLACNHQSFLDPMLATLGLARECDYMARDTLFRNRLFRWMIESLNAFPVRRGSADVGAIKETLKRLKAGRLVTVFPEATRTHDGSVAPMQPGIILIARKTATPIVPTLILGAFEAWPRQARCPHPSPVLVAYGQPLRIEQMLGRSDQECIEIVRWRIVELMEHYRRHPLARRIIRSAP